MTRIRANCPDCGDVELTPHEMQVEVAHDALGLVGDGSHYHFVCPECATTVRKPADGRIVQLLLTGGVPLAVTDQQSVPDGIGAPPGHPERAAGGPPLTWDDLLDLHLLLQQESWFDHLAASVS